MLRLLNPNLDQMRQASKSFELILEVEPSEGNVKIFQVFPCVIIGGAASIKVKKVEKLESVLEKEEIQTARHSPTKPHL